MLTVAHAPPNKALQTDRYERRLSLRVTQRNALQSVTSDE